ncbi:MAG: hypothetical protein P8P30_10655 [Rickettsiales bacterium]|nr:hypothetical protein [Rickettsiales bacterium]
MMMVTLNCDWTSPEEETSDSEIERGFRGASAVIGTEWKPICPANDNLPAWLEVYG